MVTANSVIPLLDHGIQSVTVPQVPLAKVKRNDAEPGSALRLSGMAVLGVVSCVSPLVVAGIKATAPSEPGGLMSERRICSGPCWQGGCLHPVGAHSGDLLPSWLHEQKMGVVLSQMERALVAILRGNPCADLMADRTVLFA